MTTNAAEKIVTTPESAAAGTTDRPTEKPADKRRALGRGLESLLPSGPRIVAGATAAVTAAGAATAPERTGVSAPHNQYEAVLPEVQAQAAVRGDAVSDVPLDQIDDNPYQTRYNFDREMLEELADSIKANGVVQPIVVRPSEGRYVLVLGERRCRASRMAGKTTVPAIIRRISDQQAAEMTVVENLQRQDLNCMEQAEAFRKLSQEFKLTQEQIGDRVGISRESVSNYMRLLKLPPTVTQFLNEGRLGFSEARVLLQFQDPETIAKLADEAVRKHLSVEQLEQLCIDSYLPKEKAEGRGARWVDPNVRAAQRELETVLGVRVRIRDRKGKGKIVIEYSTLEDYDRVIGMLRGAD